MERGERVEFDLRTRAPALRGTVFALRFPFPLLFLPGRGKKGRRERERNRGGKRKWGKERGGLGERAADGAPDSYVIFATNYFILLLLPRLKKEGRERGNDMEKKRRSCRFASEASRGFLKPPDFTLPRMCYVALSKSRKGGKRREEEG